MSKTYRYKLEVEDSMKRLLESMAEDGVQFERERIIRLLIDKAIEWRTADLHQQADYLDFAIELIKGEQK